MSEQPSEAAETASRCLKCGTAIEECACCQKTDCGVAICFDCLNIAIGQDVPQTHSRED